ncbi:MAG: malto-oligosyltrehalose trehalohydrolase [Candidatus Velthaea sp.]
MIGTAGYRFGAVCDSAGAVFRLFAPAARQVELIVRDGQTQRAHELEARGDGWFEGFDRTASPGMRYGFRIDGAAAIVPDPASRFQPEGVHGLSELLDPAQLTAPRTGWRGRPWNELVFYELHVGTFTSGGTYASAIERLDALVDLGITAVELMPLAQWPGRRNWGYDGVLPYAPAERYGRPADLVRFIAEAHRRRLAVFLDVVYNHFGPEGNYLHAYAPVFFTERYQTPWGAAIDYASDDVRAFFIENARWWLDAYGFDGLRLDATQMIFDERSPSVLEELRASIAAWNPPERRVHLVVENDHNDNRLLHAGYDAQWNDDFHHALHVLTTGEDGGYYADYAADPARLLGRTLTAGYGYQGEPSRFRGGAPRGSRSDDQPLAKFIDFLQNHDQIGNRARGERLSMLTGPDALRAAAAVLLLAPSPPLLFMGEEWAASTPFLFFCDFEPELAHLVTEGRRREFAGFPEFADPRARETIPDPSAPETFTRCILRWDEREAEPHRSLLAHYRTLLAVRLAEIVPRIDGLNARDASFVEHGPGALEARWNIAGGTLVLEANLTAAPGAGFLETPPGRCIFGTSEFPRGEAPPWSVRWSIV